MREGRPDDRKLLADICAIIMGVDTLYCSIAALRLSGFRRQPPPNAA